MAQRSTYDESEIVRLISDIYTTLIRMGHLEEEDVVWAPSEGHSLDLSALDDNARIDLRVVSLMERLPLLNPSAFGRALVPGMRPVNYLNKRHLALSRDIDKLEYYRPPGQGRLDMGNARPTELMLLQGEQSDDPDLILDIEDNTIRKFDPTDERNLNDEYMRTEEDPQRLDEYVKNHRNWPATDAVEYLNEIHQNYLDAQWIPTCHGLIHVVDPLFWYFAEVRRVFIEEYGWPDDFRREDWKRYGPDVCGWALDEYFAEQRRRMDPAYNEDYVRRHGL